MGQHHNKHHEDEKVKEKPNEHHEIRQKYTSNEQKHEALRAYEEVMMQGEYTTN